MQDAFTVAVERWPRDGMPPSPAGWIITTARRRAIDRLRREASRDARQAEAVLLSTPDEPREEGPVRDERLRLVFTCCHPALSTEAQVALTLRLLGGLTTPEIARAFLVPEATMAQRIVRAKRKIRDAGIPYRVPRDADLPARVTSVLSVVYLVFTEGHTATSGTELGRPDLAAEAIRLGRCRRRAHARRARGQGTARAHAPHRGSASGPHRRGRRAGAAGRPGPRPLGCRAHCRRPRPRAGMLAAQRSRAVPDPSGDQRRAHRRCERPPTPTGRRSSRSTTSCSPCSRPTSCGSTGQWPWQRWKELPRDSSSSRGWTSTATTPSTSVRADLLARLGRPDGGRQRPSSAPGP